MIVLLKKEYHGFEDAADIDRDVSELWDNHPNIRGEYQGKIKILITFEPEKGDII